MRHSLRPHRPFRRAALMLGLVLVAGLLLGPSSAATGSPPPTTETKAVATTAATAFAAAKPKNTSHKCADKARKQAKKNKKYKYWVCVGTHAKYFKKHRVPSSAVAARKGAWMSYGASNPAVSDSRGKLLRRTPTDDDSRCELVPDCTYIRTLYSADIKGNAFYGYSDAIWGTFDVIFFQSFNGASSRYRLKLIWDYGPPIEFGYWEAQIRKNLAILPDPVTGEADFFPDNISVSHWTTIKPSAQGLSNTRPTKYLGMHHDDLYGTFIANGQQFGATPIHLPNFHCPNHRCKYYGPTGQA